MLVVVPGIIDSPILGSGAVQTGLPLPVGRVGTAFSAVPGEVK
jgi:hypothetical protein